MNYNYLKKWFLIFMSVLTLLQLLLLSNIKKSFITLDNESVESRNEDTLFLTTESVESSNEDTLFFPNEIQRRIYKLQNPINCHSNRILVYDTNAYNCSFGCSIHKITTFFYFREN